MTDEQIKAALEDAAAPVTLPARFRKPSALVRQTAQQPTRRSFFKRLEFAVACVVLTGALGLVALRMNNRAPAPGGGAEPPVQVVEPGDSAARMVGVGSDGTVRLEVSLYGEEKGNRRLVSTIRNLSASTVELRYDCDNLVRLNGLTVIRDCEPLPPVKLEPGQSGLEEILLPASTVQNPTVATLAYILPGQPVSTLKVNLGEQALGITAKEVADRLRSAGLQVTGPVESTVRLFGATRVDNLTAQGKAVGVYTFADHDAAQQALRVASDPSAHTVSWVEEPQFIVMENLLIGIVSNDKGVTKQVITALYEPPPILFRPFIQEERAIELARVVDPGLGWEAHLFDQGFDVTVRGNRIMSPVWIVEAKNAENQVTVLYLDAKSGRIMTQLQVEGPGRPIEGAATPEAAVERYLALTSAGRYEEAWPRLHPVAQKANPTVSLGLRLAHFFKQEGTPGPKLRAILDVKVAEEGTWTKDPHCMCGLRKAQVRVQLEDGTEQTVQLAEAAEGTWGILWQ